MIGIFFQCFFGILWYPIGMLSFFQCFFGVQLPEPKKIFGKPIPLPQRPTKPQEDQYVYKKDQKSFGKTKNTNGIQNNTKKRVGEAKIPIVLTLLEVLRSRDY